jgi:hypothetical protein
MNAIRIRASGTLVLPEPLMDEVISSEGNGGSRILEKCRSTIISSMAVQTGVKVSFDISGNRLKTLVELSGTDFSSMVVSVFRIICDISIEIMSELKIERDDFARIMSLSDIHVLEVK